MRQGCIETGENSSVATLVTLERDSIPHLLLRKTIGHHVSNGPALIGENLTKWGKHLRSIYNVSTTDEQTFV